ncbi:MAG: ATP-dependent Clp protease ATP-binding subunit [Flavobacteriales bacterium]|jgi:ATP-dependent Clp protease ATP-binding subunit ClpA|nr:ATP-dependent Clp protease ATP-binding subunit [Flavobacteriales bacterium]
MIPNTMSDISLSLQSAIAVAKALAHKKDHTTYGVAHLAYALFTEPTGLIEILGSIHNDVGYLIEWFEVRMEVYESQNSHNEGVEADKEVLKVLEEAERSQIKLGTDHIDALCVFLSIIRVGVVYDAKQLNTLEITENEILKNFNAIDQAQYKNTFQLGEEGVGEIPFCENLLQNKLIEKGEIIVGRDQELRQILDNLEQRENKGFLIYGDSGVGKTSIIHALIHFVATTKDPLYKEMIILGVESSKILAASGNSAELSKKLSAIFDKVSKLENCLLVIDDLPILTEGIQNSKAIINLLSAQLRLGKVRLLAITGTDYYRQQIENHSIQNKILPIQIAELSPLYLSQCMENQRIKLTAYYQIGIEKNAIEQAVHFSKRYFKEQKLPNTAISLLDQTLASISRSNRQLSQTIESLEKELEKVDLKKIDANITLRYLHHQIKDKISPVILAKIQSKKELEELENAEDILENTEHLLTEIKEHHLSPIKKINENDIATIVAETTGIPIGKIQAEEKDKLLHIEEHLKERVKGQNHAIATLADAIIESRSGLSNPNQPIGSFFFLGPTGTGKTELTKSLAELLFDDENAMIRFDMSEFKEEHSAALLYGAPPGYVGYEEGGMLVNKIRQKPFSVVLFDEIEKAHSSVYDVFLQIMDEGKIHDKLNREGDFSNSIIIFTSNIGSEWIAEEFEKGKQPESSQLIEIMSPYFRPEFLGRLTEVVPFAPINKAVSEMIFKLHVARLQEQLEKEKDIKLSLSPEAITYLADKGYSKKYGARPIAGVVRTYIKKAISRMIVAQNIVENDEVLLHYDQDSLIWEKTN